MATVNADASPEKALFLDMFVRDLTLEDCVLDLIDNSIDGLIRTQEIDVSETLLPSKPEAEKSGGNPNSSVLPSISIRFGPTEFQLNDNCGGIPLDYAKKELFKFGHTPV